MGGAFEMISGQKRRAPRALSRLGLEWLWRLWIEPRRARRIVNAIIVFPLLIVHEALRRGTFFRSTLKVFLEILRTMITTPSPSLPAGRQGLKGGGPDRMNVKTRFPPSPTGFLHIGSLRTAFYNFLFAKKHDGTFLVRVEDTDRERLVEGAVESLIRTLETVGITYDEGPILVNGKLAEKGPNGPYTQSHRLEIYKEHAQMLALQGSAYYCFCSKERLEELRNQQTIAKLQTKYDRHCLKLDKEEISRRLAARGVVCHSVAHSRWRNNIPR